MLLKNCNEKHCFFHLQKLNIENIALKKCNENHCAFQQHKLSNENQYLEFQSCPFLFTSYHPARLPACPSAHLPSFILRIKLFPFIGQWLCMEIPINNNKIPLLSTKSEACS